jgi:dephospho-CoA kinase
MKIAFSGKMTAGKTVSAQYLTSNFGFKKLAFADSIYEISDLFFKVYQQNYGYTKFYEDIEKKCLKLFKTEKDVYKGLIALGQDLYTEFVEVGPTMTFKDPNHRLLLQKIGTEKCRAIDPRVWILDTARTIDSLPNANIVIDDLRFIDEFKALKALGFTIIRIDLDAQIQKERILNFYGTYNIENTLHRSELELDDQVFDYHINGNASKLEMFTQVAKIIEEVQNGSKY